MMKIMDFLLTIWFSLLKVKGNQPINDMEEPIKPLGGKTSLGLVSVLDHKAHPKGITFGEYRRKLDALGAINTMEKAKQLRSLEVAYDPDMKKQYDLLGYDYDC